VKPSAADDHLGELLAEQLAYYRARAPEYTETAIPEFSTGVLSAARRELLAALDAFRPTGEVLELACGPGTWTPHLLHHASSVTAVDAAPEMLAIAAANIHDERVRFMQANLFDWEPDRHYDVVFFGFWLSHVPLERFPSFWSTVGDCLKPGGRVAFVDDAYRTADELIEGDRSSTIRRHLKDGTAFRAVKVPHTAEGLQERLARLGWDFTVTPLRGPFFWGVGRKA
jgi:demethylmenaquinone methyltransferase/2-methoxy-6-polyprenyl-1,4-benzoquinol methylase